MSLYTLEIYYGSVNGIVGIFNLNLRFIFINSINYHFSKERLHYNQYYILYPGVCCEHIVLRHT